MLKIRFFALPALALLLVARPARAQQTGTPPPVDALPETEIVIEKSRKNELPPAGRNFEKVPFTPPPPQKRQVNYDFPDFKLSDRPLTVSPRVAPIRQEAVAPVPGVYAEVGFGNYLTPYGRLGAHTKPSDQYHAGLDVRHQSSGEGPVDKKNSAGGNTRVSADGEYFGKGGSVGARIEFERQSTHFYGYDKSWSDRFKNKADSLLQTHTRFGGELFARTNNAKSKFQGEAGVGFRSWKNKSEASESNVLPRVSLSFASDEHNRVALRAEGSFISYTPYKSAAKVSRPYANATLAFEHDGEKVDASIGASFGYSGDTINKAKKANIYPAVRLSLEAVEDRLIIFFGATGGMERTDLFHLTRENPWLADKVASFDTLGNMTSSALRVADVNHQLAAYGGFALSPARGARLLVRGTYNMYRNLYFINPSLTDTTRFELLYDSTDVSTKNLNVHAELTIDVGQKVQFAIKGDYDNWDLASKNLARPWHRPTFQATASLAWNIGDKLLLSGETYVIGSSYAQGGLQVVNNEFRRIERKTDTVIDVNARLDYHISPQLSIFAMGQNLLGKQYQRYINYPVRGLTVIGGLGYQF